MGGVGANQQKLVERPGTVSLTALRSNQPAHRLDVRLPASRIVRQHISVV